MYITEEGRNLPTIKKAPKLAETSICLRSLFLPILTAYSDLLAIASGDVIDVWQLLEVLSGFM